MEETGDEDVDTIVAFTNHHSEEEEETALTGTRLYLVVLGCFCALVTGTAIYMGIKTTTQEDRLEHLATETQNLMERRMTLNEDIKYLIDEKDKKDPICKPCADNWMIFRQKCYLFFDSPPPWKTWEQSRKFCQDKRADLVVIDDLEEQQFVSRNIKFYFGKSHGYWIGLEKVNNTWTWINGRADTLGFWAKKWNSEVGSYALVHSEQNPNNCWSKEHNRFQNKFICERDARKI